MGIALRFRPQGTGKAVIERRLEDSDRLVAVLGEQCTNRRGEALRQGSEAGGRGTPAGESAAFRSSVKR
jgi:hypothetical protein